MTHPEDTLQESCVLWWDLTFNSHPEIKCLLHHSPNGGFRNPREAARFKRMGTRAGFPDLLLCMKSGNGKYIGLFMELKAGKNTQTDLQKLYQQAVEAQGYKYVVVRSFIEFKQTVEDYINI